MNLIGKKVNRFSQMKLYQVAKSITSTIRGYYRIIIQAAAQLCLTVKALSHRRDVITRCVSAINGRIKTFFIIYFNTSFTSALRVQCEQIIEIDKVLFFSVNRIDASRYRVASVWMDLYWRIITVEDQLPRKPSDCWYCVSSNNLSYGILKRMRSFSLSLSLLLMFAS